MRCSTLIPIRKCFKIQSILIMSLVFTIVLVCHQIDRSSTDNLIENDFFPTTSLQSMSSENRTCDDNQREFPSNDYLKDSIAENDVRPRPTISRLETLFAKLISYEDKFQKIFQQLAIFRWTNLSTSLKPYAANQNQHFQEIFCLFQRYLSHSNRTHVHIQSSFIDYLKKVSNYLSEGFQHSHSTWTETSIQSQLIRPVIVLAANSRFFDTLQSSMRTVDQYFRNHTVVIYDLGFTSAQLKLIEWNCRRCLVIPFPFALFDSGASHVRSLGNFAWKPIVIQDALRRFGSIIYGDTSVRYRTSNFEHLLIDNLLRGFACRELPGHYLPCFTQSKTFEWFNENSSNFDEIYIAEAGFLAVTDTFLSRLILKTWITCALDSQCIAPTNSHTTCRRLHGKFQTHRFDQSAMVTLLSFYFFPSVRQADKTHPAPYDMYASIQEQIAEVKRFEGDDSYFTQRPH